MTVERRRLEGDRRGWLNWGPYLAERAWATVREDYSPHGDEVWGFFPHEHARSRAYRWNEDGLGGICDRDQEMCLAFAFWNGRDRILKERIFGVTGDEGNHGEDAKEYWWYLDSTPTHSYMRWAYAYPQRRFPYGRLVAENQRRGRLDREYELEDTDIFANNRYWDIVVEYAKDDTDDLTIVVNVTNQGPKADTIHVLPTVWFRNTWSYELGAAKPEIVERDGALVARRLNAEPMTLIGDGDPQPLFCDNETNASLLFGHDDSPPYPKDGINDAVIAGAKTVNPELTGTKAALWYQHEVEPGETITIKLRFAPEPGPHGVDVATEVVDRRRAEADEFYAEVIPSSVDDDERTIARQAFAGMLWTKQFYHFDLERWLHGDPGQPAPPAERLEGRNANWWHIDNADIISMPDAWEYPWFAAWDLAFHAEVFARIDPDFAKEQLLLLCGANYQHPNGQLPAYEWSFGDVNPPVHAMAALAVYRIDGSRDTEFLSRIFSKLLLNFNWWVNRKDAEGHNVFAGGFLGLDNIGPLDRSEGIPQGYRLEQSDGTAWMAAFALRMMEIALELATAEDDTHRHGHFEMASKFFDHFAYIATAIHERGLWDDDSGFYYDMLRTDDGETTPISIRSMVGLIPLFATTALPTDRVLEPSPFADHLLRFVSHRRRFAANVLGSRHTEAVSELESGTGTGTEPRLLLAMADLDRLDRILSVMLDEQEMLSPFGIRSLSAAHREEPFLLDIGPVQSRVAYEPGESSSPLFGGNSNWRGPIWFPVNHLLIESLREYHRYAGDHFLIEYPTGSGEKVTLADVADDLSRRLVSLFHLNAGGARNYGGESARRWPDRLLFHEYFDGDAGDGLGASHQTGWTGLVAELICRRGEHDRS